jgi:diamine N-acetyltransferase
MSAELHPITSVNWRELIKLQVREDQKNFVASNLYSIAESQFGHDSAHGHWSYSTFGIYDNDVAVGFLMYGLNFEHPWHQAFITRLMVDEKFQGKGYGRFGMQRALEVFRADERIMNVAISYEPDNEVARKLYASLGFYEPGEMVGDETLAVLKLR